MKLRYRIVIGTVLALALVLSLGGSAWAASPRMVRVIIGWAPSGGLQAQSGLSSKSGPFSQSQTLGQVGGRVNQNFHLVSATTAEIPETQIESLRNTLGVAYVELDSEVHITGETIPWGISDIKADQAQNITSGAGAKVAVIDTGIDLGHSDLKVAGNISLVGTANGNDDNGHGTHVAGTIAALKNNLGVVGVAPNAQLYAVKALDASGSGYVSTIISAIQWATDNHMNVINMSLGGGSGSTALQQACDTAYEAGIIIVAAAGNNGYYSGDSVQYPAAYDSVIAVGAVDKHNNRAAFSSNGPKLELMAPGVGIKSTYKGNTYVDSSGTSMAAPHVSGAAALLFANGVADKNHNGRINDEIRTILNSTSTDLGSPGRDTQCGFGLVNTLKAVQTANMNNTPAANAGPDQSVNTNTTVTLNGSNSKDADGDWLSYSWTQTSGTKVSLTNAKSVKATFTPAAAGIYVFQLTVSDGKASSSDSVTINATTPVAKGLKVKSINLGSSKSGSKLSITATVVVTDLTGATLSGVTVQGHWSGNASGNVSGSTNSSGSVTFSKTISNPISGSNYGFTVDKLAKSGYTYNSANNLMSSSSITWKK